LLEDFTKNIVLSATDADNDLMTYQIVSNPAHGNLTGSAPNLTYEPNANYNGSDSFTFKANDGKIDSNNATISISVSSVNDEPSFTINNQTSIENVGLVTVSGFATFTPGPSNESGQLATYYLSNDNNALFSTQPSVDPSGTLTYQSAQDSTGLATITIFVTDDGGVENGGDDTSPSKTFTITVNPGKQVYVNSFDVTTNGKKRWTGDVTTTVFSSGLPVANALVTGTWSGGATGPASCTTNTLGQCLVSQSTTANTLTFTVVDIAGIGLSYNPSSVDSVTFDSNGNIQGGNFPPQANNDSASVTRGSSVIIPVTANDNDSDGILDLNSIVITVPPLNHSSLVNNGDGTITYTHNGSDTSSDSFKYTIKDNVGATSNEATVSITINAPVPITKVHVQSITSSPLSTNGPWTNLSITIKVHDHNNPSLLLSGVTVNGNWSGILSGSVSCVTDQTGTCTLSDKSKTPGSAIFIISSLSGTGYQYDPPNDADSITIIIP